MKRQLETKMKNKIEWNDDFTEAIMFVRIASGFVRVYMSPSQLSELGVKAIEAEHVGIIERNARRTGSERRYAECVKEERCKSPTFLECCKTELCGNCPGRNECGCVRCPKIREVRRWVRGTMTSG